MTKRENNQYGIDSEEFTVNGCGHNSDQSRECCEEATDNVSECDECGGDNPTEKMTEEGAQAQIDEWRDKYLRLSAEFDNYRRRTIKEKSEIAVMGGQDVIRAILPVLDDIDRAVEVMHSSEDIISVRTGIELISHKLRDMLKGQGLMEIEALGKELDTDFHEAVATTPAAKKSQRGKIVDIAQKGYAYKDKVIRHTKVVVGE